MIVFVKDFSIVLLKMSNINFERRCAIRFFFRLGHSATEILPKLQKIEFYQEPRFFGGLRHFQKGESRLKMNPEAEGFHLQEPIKMLTESGILCVQIVD